MVIGGPLAHWRNWSGNQRATPSAIEHPRTVGEVAQIVCRAAADGRQVRVAGSGHSFTAAAVTDAIMIHLDRMPRSGTIGANGLVTVPGGARFAPSTAAWTGPGWR